MTQRTTASTDIKVTTPTLKAFITDALGICKEAELGQLGNFIRWRFQDWQGTALESPYVCLQELTGATIDLSEDISRYFHRGPGFWGKIVSITDAYNIVVDLPTEEVSSHKSKVDEGSTAEETTQGPTNIMQQELIRYVEHTIDHLFDRARELYFEDGMETDFSRDLIFLVKKYGVLAMTEISYLITFDRVDEEVAGEALRWLARIDDSSTYGWRFWLLDKGLLSKSPVVRDSAALGLLSMCDANAIPHLRKAIERETIVELRNDLQGALRELEVSLDAAAATSNKQA